MTPENHSFKSFEEPAYLQDPYSHFDHYQPEEWKKQLKTEDEEDKIPTPLASPSVQI